MRIHPRILTSAIAFAITCVVSTAVYYYKSRNTELNEVMVFCKLQYNAYNYFDKLISYIEAAKHSVNVCMPGIHNPAIQSRLVQLIKRKNIIVRIIIDQAGYNDSTEFLIKELLNAGAKIRYKVNDHIYRMQHKFCLVDDEVLMTGTLNWGNERTSDHWNYVYITSKKQLVDPVRSGFYAMWNEHSSDMNIDTQSYESDLETEFSEDELNSEHIEKITEMEIIRENESTTVYIR
ncbi:mitochondrial cardiolipin hydrolase-like [Galleria mellonella]|uniref:Mitochondrial cardiolipin hydrolase n=1 Tax=Galleria mellonella TaxID=7137 RepID=A0ABM3MF73_GALME|nr:mitochondrial cardiolipin hydrolase-like [Galleria mellonella]